MKPILSLLLAGLALYEIAALLNSTAGDTLSELVWSASHRPLLPFLFGLVAGHFFWQKKES